ncbi:hypothetical protein WJX73_009931 [Symbiochloris irregularis]|uniref:Large ribosomal subunit protein uL4c n=1 Tax=Symbiochloris irregularis TaxID=706552 RepID=A0AAW1NNP5_9CHLO
MEHELLLPSANGFRLCRSHPLPCAHLTYRRSPVQGRAPLRQNKRQGNASTLTRAEVRGGGRKPFAQKGTGNARQGSSRTPLKPGGGVIFGPKPRDWSIKMNKKERRLAYATAFQNAAESITVVDDLEGSLTQPRTKELMAALKRWGVDPEAHTLIIVDRLFDNLNLAGRNVRNVVFNTINNLSVYDLLRADRVVVESSALSFIQEFYGASSTPNSKAVAPPVTYADTSAPDLSTPIEASSAEKESPAEPEAAAEPESGAQAETGAEAQQDE